MSVFINLKKWQVEEEEEPKEGEEPKAEVTSALSLNVGVVFAFFKCVTESIPALVTRMRKRKQRRLKLRSIGTGN